MTEHFQLKCWVYKPSGEGKIVTKGEAEKYLADGWYDTHGCWADGWKKPTKKSVKKTQDKKAE